MGLSVLGRDVLYKIKISIVCIEICFPFLTFLLPIVLNHMTFVQIGEFDWLSGRQKGSIFVKMFKNLLLRNHLRDEAETWHTCLGH